MAEDLKPYTVYLKAGTELTSTKDQSVSILSKGIYASVLEINPKRRTLFNVYDKNGIVRYQTTSEGVVEIENDIKLLPGLNAEETYPAKSVFNAENKVAKFGSQFNIHFESFQLSHFNEIYKDEITSVFSQRYEVRTLYNPEWPLKFGFGLNFQNAYWKNNIESIRLSILSLGPHFQYTFFESEDVSWSASTGVEIAPLYESSSSLYSDNYSAVLYDAGLESVWKSEYGLFSLGSHFRFHDIVLTKSNRPNRELKPKEYSLYTLGVMIGYKLEWDL
jgi:hypothetical protein